MAKGSTYIQWDDKELRKNLGQFDNHVRKAMLATVLQVAPQAESWAKSNAPWTDQTGNARNGLRGQGSMVGPNSAEVGISHSMPYGIWLEVRWSGKYSIIMKTVNHFAPLTFGLFRQLIARR